VAYQGIKKCKTSDMLNISDSREIPLVCSDAYTSEFRLSHFKNNIIGNIDVNKRNGQQNNSLFMNSFINVDLLFKGLIFG